MIKQGFQVEKNLYGWLWECPNGGEKCVYTHALPAGYVLQRDKKQAAKALENDDDELTLEEKIEEDRAKLPTILTPVTLETFNDWKRRKAEKKQKELEDRMKEEAKKAGSKGGHSILSGKALFKYDPSLFKDDENAADEQIYEEREEFEEDEEEKKESDDLRNGQEDGQKDMIKSSVKASQDTNGSTQIDTNVDADLFQQENHDEEEPDFD